MSTPDGTVLTHPPGWSTKALRTKEQPISFLIAAALRDPDLVNLAAGLVDPYSLPVDDVRRITQKILGDEAHGRRALQYDTTLGLADLRRHCLSHLADLEGKPAAALGYTADDIVVTTGSQQALYLIGDLLVDPGDIVIAANPSYFVYTGTLQSLGAHVLSVPMDPGGMDVDAVAALLEKLDREGRVDKVKFVYCTSYFDNPTGLSLAADRRPRLLELVKRYSRKHRILILEDAAYRELRYDGPDLPSIKSYDPENRFVVISHTFSKPFAPGLKLGYTVMPSDLAHAAVQQKGNHDFGSSSLAMHVAAEAMADGSYLAQGKRLRDTYRKKRGLTLAALAEHFGPLGGSGVGEWSSRGVEKGAESGRRSATPTPPLHHATTPPRISWTHPNGGLYVWLTLPPGVDTSRTGPLFPAAVSAGVLYVPGDYCFQPDDRGHVPLNHVRLCFGQVHPDKINLGVERLAAAVAELLEPAGTTTAARREPALAD
ncbi:MAG: PLP-dependent aminotransferase family protein [Phycisphaerales bacterium]|nr:PLP-dependent aminotransferase family protein [Phycisphaerales bacterium]